MIDIFTGFKVPPELCDWWWLPPAVRHPQKKHVLDFLSMYLVIFINFHGFEVPLVKLSKSGQSDQMTMPARRASKFSAKWRAIKLQTIFQSLNSQAIPGFCEPWSECQPEGSGLRSAKS